MTILTIANKVCLPDVKGGMDPTIIVHHLRADSISSLQERTNLKKYYIIRLIPRTQLKKVQATLSSNMVNALETKKLYCLKIFVREG